MNMINENKKYFLVNKSVFPVLMAKLSPFITIESNNPNVCGSDSIHKPVEKDIKPIKPSLIEENDIEYVFTAASSSVKRNPNAVKVSS